MKGRRTEETATPRLRTKKATRGSSVSYVSAIMIRATWMVTMRATWTTSDVDYVGTTSNGSYVDDSVPSYVDEEMRCDDKRCELRGYEEMRCDDSAANCVDTVVRNTMISDTRLSQTLRAYWTPSFRWSDQPPKGVGQTTSERVAY